MIPHTQILYVMATSYLNHNKSQIMVSSKRETLEQEISELQ